MNFIKGKKISWIGVALLIIMCITFDATLYSMAEMVEGAEVGLEAGAKEAAIEAAEKAFGTAEELGTADIESMREGFQEDLQNEVSAAIEKIKNIDPELNPDSPEYKAEVENIFKEAKTNFFEKVASSDAMSARDLNVFDRMNIDPADMKVLNEMPAKPFSEVNIPRDVTVEPEPELPPANEQASLAHDEVQAAQENLKEAYKNGGKEAQVTEAQGKLDEAQTSYNEKAKTVKEAAQTKAETAKRDVVEAKNNLEAAKKAGDPEAIKTAKDEIATKEADAKTAKTENEEIAKQQAKQEYDQAKSAKETADQEYETAKKVYEKGDPRIEEAKTKAAEAKTAVDEAKQALLDKTGYLENKGLRIADAAGKAGTGFYEGLKTGGSFIWTKFGESIMGGVLFQLGPMAMQAAEDAAKNKTENDSLRTPQKFGNINLVLPEWLINSEEPSKSKFVYVGVPNKDQSLTKEFLATANYYVSKSDYGPLAAYAVSDPNFPNVMIHLNTGFIFVGDGQPYDPEPEKMTMPLLKGKDNLVMALNDLSGEVSHGAKSETYQYYQLDRSSGYSGNPAVGALFETDTKIGYPPLLHATVTALQNGTLFGKYSLQGIRGLGGSNPDNKKMWNLIAAENTLAASDEPYVAQGVHIYQTKDTPFIKNLRESLAPDDPNQKVLLNELVDYVVLFNEDRSKIVPLQVPQAEPPYNYASYVLNDLEESGAKYMVSLLETGAKLIPARGVAKIEAPEFKVTDIPNITNDLVTQIAAFKTYCEEAAVKGPFNYGAVKLTIDPKLLESETYIYKAAGYLPGGVDDYFVALKGANATKLPASDIQLFVSLVTSRFYDPSLNPYQPPIPKSNVLYHVATTDISNDKKAFVTTGALTSKMTELYSGKAPLYTLFVEYPFNPNNPPAGTKVTMGQLTAAFSANWALDNLKMGADAKAPTISKFLEDNTTLLNAIQTSHDAWVKTLDKSDPGFISKQMGPFDFTTDQLHNVQLSAVSEDAIKHQNFVYVSDSYPEGLLVMSEDALGQTDLGHAFGTQRYAISLSNGNVYDSKPQPDAHKLSGEKSGQIENLDDLVTRAQATSPYIPTLLQKIKDSQFVYNGTLASHLYGPDVGFGRFKFYINKNDYRTDQFIYADVTNLDKPLDAKGNEISAVVSQIKDYFVCVVRTPDSTQKDGYAYSFGDQLSGDTYSVVSLISGASYDRAGKYLGSYEQFVVEDSAITNILDFTNTTLGVIAKKSGKAVRLTDTITKLTQLVYDNIATEEKELAAAKLKEQKTYIPLDGNLKANLDLETIPYNDNPNLLPRYVKQYQDKYYTVTPGYVLTTPPSKDTPLNSPGPDRIYIDYNLGVGKDSGMGMIYDSMGAAKLLLTGWSLANARAFAGIVVDSTGKQTRTLGMAAPMLPMTGAKTKTLPTGEFMVPTGFKPITVSGIQFDFYYHNQLDSYFVKVSTPNQKKYYIHLTSGYGYNLDGTPRWFESPLYKDKDGNLLLVGTDQFDVRKVALRKPTLPGKPQEPYTFYTMVGRFSSKIGDKIKSEYQAEGSFYDMINDIDPDQRIRVMLCDRDLEKRPLPTPYYLVWGVSDKNSYVLIGQYKQDDSLRYSLLLYAQTRNAGDPVEKGSFNPSDNYIDPKAKVLKPKTVGIIFDQNHSMKKVFYRDQVCMVTGNKSSYLKTNPADGTQTLQPITVTINHKAIQAQAQSDQPGMQAYWLSIDDGAYSYDYVFDTMILDPSPEKSSGEVTAQHLNLYDLKHNLWQLDVSSFVNAAAPSGISDPNQAVSSRALVSVLNADKDPGTITFPSGLAESLKAVPNNSLGFITADKTGSMFINNRSSGPTIRFAYQLGPQGDAKDTNPNYYIPYLNGWYVDISNGILYDSSGFPSGQSLMPSQLDILLDTLQLSVVYDFNETTKIATPRLQYRMLTPPTTTTLK